MGQPFRAALRGARLHRTAQDDPQFNLRRAADRALVDHHDVVQLAVANVRAVVPQIAPSYDWIRLAQRVPVTISFKEIPDDIVLVAGATVSVAIDPGGSR